MGTRADRRLRFLLPAAALAVTAVSIAGLLRSARAGYTDALFEPDYTIRYAPPEGPLAQAGFREGDSVVAVEGIPVEELGMYSRWPRSLRRGPGESLKMTVLRQGRAVEGQVVYRQVPREVVRTQVAGAVVILSFLWSGLWAFLSVGTPAALRLALLGLALSLEVAGVPGGSWSGVVDHVQVAGGVLGTLLLARFFLRFPAPKRLAGSPFVTGALYGAWLLLLCCLAVELAFHPRFYHSFGGLIGVLMLGYLLLALGSAIHTAATTPRQELGDSGMGIILVGGGVAVALILVAAADWVIPAFAIPGSGWLALGSVLIPFSMALGVRKHARRPEPGPAY